MSKLFGIFKEPVLYLILIIILAFWVRLYRIENPVADWHSWRQADTAAVARNFYKEGFTPFVPRYDDMSMVSETLKSNPGRYRFVEFPIYNTLVYLTYLINGGVNEALARLVAVMFSLGSLIFIYLIVKRHFDTLTALAASFLYAILPFNIYFSRVILPEPALVFFSLGMFYFTEKWIWENTRSLLVLSLFFIACAFLIKPMAIFYLLPLGLSIYQKEETINLFKYSKRYFILLLAFIPLVLWRIWMLNHPEGIPMSDWLYNSNNIRFRPAFFRWIVGERFGKEILGVAGTSLFVLGLMFRPLLKQTYLLHLLAFSSFLFLIVFATGNVQHDYYQYLIIPALVIFTARGLVFLLRGLPPLLPRIITIPVAIFLLILTIYLPWLEVRGLYQINNPAIVEAGKKADELLPQDAIVVAPYNGDTSFLYQTNRPGWAITALPIKELQAEFGITHYVSTTKDSKTRWLMYKYVVMYDDPLFVIIDLTKFSPNFNPLDDIEPS